MITKPDRDILKIDLNNLENECAEHSQLAFLWGEELALAKKKLGEAENALIHLAAMGERLHDIELAFFPCFQRRGEVLGD